MRPRPEVVLGGETRIVDLLFAYLRPAGETLLLLIDRWYRSGDEPAKAPGSLWVAPRRPQASGGIPARDSLLAPFQLGHAAAARPADAAALRAQPRARRRPRRAAGADAGAPGAGAARPGDRARRPAAPAPRRGGDRHGVI